MEVLKHVHTQTVKAYIDATESMMRWFGPVQRMDDGQIPMNPPYGELAAGDQPTGCPTLCCKDACKHDMKVAETNTNK